MSSLSVVQLAVVSCYLFSFMPSLSQANHCRGSATYTLTFKAEWTRTSHPTDFPSGAHFSSLAVCSHKKSYVMWRPRSLATPGVQRVAERESSDYLYGVSILETQGKPEEQAKLLETSELENRYDVLNRVEQSTPERRVEQS